MSWNARLHRFIHSPIVILIGSLLLGATCLALIFWVMTLTHPPSNTSTPENRESEAASSASTASTPSSSAPLKTVSLPPVFST